MIRWWLLAILVGFSPAARADDKPAPKAETGKSDKVKVAEKEYAIPYRLTDTKHVLVRVKVNPVGASVRTCSPNQAQAGKVR